MSGNTAPSIAARFRIVRKDFVLDVDLCIPARGVTAIFGPSGCGKTTLLHAVAGLEFCAGGLLRIGAMVWQDGGKFVPPHRRSLGYVFQETSLFTHLNVRGNLAYGFERTPAAERKVSLERAIELFHLGPLLQRRVDTLSGGERQRVALGRALAANPQILLLDEPLAALDEPRKQEILPDLEALHAELDIPVLYVSHQLDEVVRLADHLVLLEAGRVRASGPLESLVIRRKQPPETETGFILRPDLPPLQP